MLSEQFELATHAHELFGGPNGARDPQALAPLLRRASRTALGAAGLLACDPLLQIIEGFIERVRLATSEGLPLRFGRLCGEALAKLKSLYFACEHFDHATRTLRAASELPARRARVPAKVKSQFRPLAFTHIACLSSAELFLVVLF